MKKLLAMLLILCTALPMAACGGDSSFVVSAGESVTLYLLVSQTHYNAEGTNWKTIEYTYNEKGLILSEEWDMRSENVWNDALETYVSTQMPCDGIADTTYSYTYDKFGNVTQYTRSYYDGSSQTAAYAHSYNGDGTIASTNLETGDGTKSVYTYTYDDGKLVNVQWENLDPDASANFSAFSWDCAYGRDGNLISVECSSANVNGVYFLYNSDGKLQTYANGSETAYTYDADGRKLTAGKLRYTYDDGVLTGITGSTMVYTCDANGNIIRGEAENGARVEYTYRSMTLSPQEAALACAYWGAKTASPTLFPYGRGDDFFYYLLSDPRWETNRLVPAIT